jgi:hypothetical protein
MTRGALVRAKIWDLSTLGCLVRGRYRDFCQSDFLHPPQCVSGLLGRCRVDAGDQGAAVHRDGGW